MFTLLQKNARRALLGSILAVSSALSAEAQDDFEEVAIALGTDDKQFNVTTSSVYQLAEDMGFFDKHKVKVTYIGLDGTPLAAAALQSGDVDVADITLDAAIRLRAANDFPLRGFTAVATGSPFLMAAKDDIQTLADLEGRSYAIADNGSLDHILTQAVLRNSGMDTDAPSYVAIGAPPVRVQALAVGRIDATTVSFGTYSSVAGTPGIHVLLSADEFSSNAPAYSKLLFAREDVLEEKREAIQRFTMALIETSREMANHPEKWVEAASSARPDLEREKIQQTSDFIATRWCINGCMKREELQRSLDFVYANPEFAEMPTISVAEITDLSFSEKALEFLGVASGAGLDARN